MAKDCILYDRKCIECDECEMCDMNANKRCNNCGKCLEEDASFRTLKVGDFFKKREEKKF